MLEAAAMNFDAEPVYDLIREVPAGSVASYGMIASLSPGVTSRMVGRALSVLSDGDATPWHRIINASGFIAERPGAGRQRRRLQEEGVRFKPNGAIDWGRYAWRGPSPVWIARTGRDPEEVMQIVAAWRQRRRKEG